MQNESSDKIMKYNSIVINNIYFFESHRRGVNAFLKGSSVPVPDSLNTLAENFLCNGFIQISKWCIVNINHVTDLKVRLNSQIDLTLNNKTVVTVNRTYIKGFRNYLRKGTKK